MKKTFLLQCLLCMILLFASITLSLRQNKRAYPAGAFGSACISNDTFEDFSKNLLGELFE